MNMYLPAERKLESEIANEGQWFACRLVISPIITVVTESPVASKGVAVVTAETV